MTAGEVFIKVLLVAQLLLLILPFGVVALVVSAEYWG